MAGVRGLNTEMYLDVDLDDEYIELDVLIPSSKPSGPERAVATQEPALDETIEFDDTGGLRYANLEFTMFYQPGDAIDESIDTALVNDTEVNIVFKINLATPQYLYYRCKFIQAIPQAIERNSKIKRDCVAIVRAAPTKSTTAPTLEP